MKITQKQKYIRWFEILQLAVDATWDYKFQKPICGSEIRCWNIHDPLLSWHDLRYQSYFILHSLSLMRNLHSVNLIRNLHSVNLMRYSILSLSWDIVFCHSHEILHSVTLMRYCILSLSWDIVFCHSHEILHSASLNLIKYLFRQFHQNTNNDFKFFTGHLLSTIPWQFVIFLSGHEKIRLILSLTCALLYDDATLAIPRTRVCQGFQYHNNNNSSSSSSSNNNSNNKSFTCHII